MNVWASGPLRKQVVERPRDPIWWGATLTPPTLDELRDIWQSRRAFNSRTRWERVRREPAD